MVRTGFKTHRPKKWIAVFVIAALVVLWHETIIGGFYDILDIDTAPAVVLALPAGYPDRSPQKPYQGRHPSTFERPPDSFQYPIKLGQVGPKESLYAGPLKYPFLCMTEDSGLGQPRVDNQEGSGIAVYGVDTSGEKTKEIIGYSKDCMAPTQAWYLYNRLGSQRFYPLADAQDDISRIQFEGKEIDFVIRVEMGVINRHVYVIAALRGPEDQLEKPDNRYWNRKLIYQFRGGVGIGFKQGKNRPGSIAKRRHEALLHGYAVAYSTANQTSNTYDIWLQEETALRVKRQFVALYGEPDYTVGIGGSGGAIQQYLIAQNNPGLLDAAIALYSFPDMITQTIHGLDCELLEYYFDVLSNRSLWDKWENRRWIEGTNAKQINDDYAWAHQLSLLFRGMWPFKSMGSSECTAGWRGPNQLINNPRYFHYFKHFSEDVYRQVHWTYWEDLKVYYGVGDDGYALQTWDNIGVQYGLKALTNDQISMPTFLELNSRIGGWKPSADMRPVRYWRYSGTNSSITDMSLWTDHNMNLSGDAGQTPAKRSLGNIEAMQAAYLSGNVFIGKVGIPIIDVRHYMDSELDMHHSFASFSTRLRLIEGQGHADNQVIWMTRKPFDPRWRALQAVDLWMNAIKQNLGKTVVENKPAQVEDACFDEQGELIKKGKNVWDGQWNHRPTGDCLALFPNFQSSRNVAGAPLTDSIFKCHLQSIDQAITKGVYGALDVSGERARLKEIFPDGVCDYTRGDAGRPAMMN